jgi:hypothetical protein
MNWLPLAQDTDQCRALVDAAAILPVLQNVTVCSFQNSIHENLSDLLSSLICFLVCLLFCWSVGWLVSCFPGFSQSDSWLVTWSSASLVIGFQGGGSDQFDAYVMKPVSPDRTRAASCVEQHDD